MNLGPEHLSRIESGEEPSNLDDCILDVKSFVITMSNDQYRDIIHFFSTGYVLDKFTTTKNKQLVVGDADF